MGSAAFYHAACELSPFSLSAGARRPIPFADFCWEMTVSNRNEKLWAVSGHSVAREIARIAVST